MAAGHKDTLLVWNDAVITFDKGPQNHDQALQTLQQIESPSAKILYNMGHMKMSAGDLGGAMQDFQFCIDKDAHLAIAHFQLGLCFYRQGHMAESNGAYDKAVTCLRGNKFIDYKQLGMPFRLHECEINYNLALAYSKILSSPGLAIDVLNKAIANKAETRHGTMIGAALTKLKNHQSYDPFTIPAGMIFRPAASKVANLKNIDYLGKAKVVSELAVPPGGIGDKTKRGPSPQPPTSPPNVFRPIDSTADNGLLSPPGRGPPPGRTPPASPNAGLVRLKDHLVMWNEGVIEYDKRNYQGALECFLKIAEPSTKILFSMALLQVRLGQTDAAMNTVKSALDKDQHMAIAHFLLGNLYCKINNIDDAWRCYEKSLECFRSNKSIDYKQLGMAYKLCECEVLYNQAYTYAKLGEIDWCTKLLGDAQKSKQEEKHSMIDTAAANFKQGTLFNIMDLPLNLVFRPPQDKVANLKKQDYLGKKKVVSELKINKPPTPPQINSNFDDGELYLPMAPGPGPSHQNTYGPPARPQKPRPPPPSVVVPPPAPRRNASLGGSTDRSPSPGLPARLPPSLPPPKINNNNSDSFDSDSFDEDAFEDEYKLKPVPVPGSIPKRGFSPFQPLPPDPPDGSGNVSPDLPQRPPPARPVPSPRGSPNPSPASRSPLPPRKSVPSGPARSPVQFSDRPAAEPPYAESNRLQKPLVRDSNASRIRKLSQGPPSKALPVPGGGKESPVPERPPPPTNGRYGSPKNSPSLQRKISPPSKPVPVRSSSQPAPAPPPPPASYPANPQRSRTQPGPPPPPPPPSKQLPPPPNKGLPAPPKKTLPLRPTRPLTNGTKRPPPKLLERRLSTTHVVAIAPFEAEEEGQLSFGTGELIQVNAEVDDYWLEGELRGSYGMFPRENVNEMSLPSHDS